MIHRAQIRQTAPSDTRPDIIQELVRESRGTLAYLQPELGRLGMGGPHGECWQIMNCGYTDCHLHGKNHELPCWLHAGRIIDSPRLRSSTEFELVCRSCKVFWLINGDRRTTNAAFRFFHAVKGCADFLQLLQISSVAAAAEVLLDLLLNPE